MNKGSYKLQNTQDSILFARKLAASIKAGDVVTFHGDLGSGKTFICREIIRFLSGNDLVVPSPTFNLLQIYESPISEIYHYDLYRLKSQEEIYELGFEEAMNDKICLIEWPEIIENLLPSSRIEVHLKIAEQETRTCDLILKA